MKYYAYRLMHFGDVITLQLRLKRLANIAHQAAHQSRRRVFSQQA